MTGLLAMLVATSPLAEATAHYQEGELEKARSALEALLYPLRLDSAPLERDARLLLAATYFALDDRGRAEEEAVRAFGVTGDSAVDPLLFPPDFQAFAAEVKSRNASRIAVLAAQRKATERPALAPSRAPLLSPSPPEQPALAWTFVPFGVPQRQNGELGKATLLAWSQGVCAAAALGGLAGALALRGPDGKYAPADAALARPLNVVYLAGSYCFLGLYAYGVVDGLAHR